MNKPDLASLPGGWFSDEDIDVYRTLVSNVPIGGKMLELGTWKGRSLCSVSDIIIERDIKVWAVDTFEGTIDEGDIMDNEGTSHLGEVRKQKNELDIQDVFDQNLRRYNIRDRVVDYRKTTDEAVSEFVDGTFDLIFIDADHSRDAVRKDVLNYKSKLKEGGVLSGHDICWQSVRDGLADAGLGPNAMGNVWYLGDLKKNRKYSICFIGRNEAKTLPNALRSLIEFKMRGGEVCYLDTGSKDNTAQIARDWGCKVEEVGDIFRMTITEEQAVEINDKFITGGEEEIVKAGDTLFDFSGSRNYCAEKLATNDMISWMDCDECMTRMDIDRIEALIGAGYDQFEYNFVFAHDQNKREVVKFVQSKFYNKKKLKWRGIIHEVLHGVGHRMFLDENVFKLEHWQNMETPRGGYLKGLALGCYQEPNYDRNSHYFARELMWNGRPKSAIKEFKRHLTLSTWDQERCQSMLFIGECCFKIGQEKEGVDWVHKALQECRNRREPFIFLAQYYKSKGEWQRVASYCMAALEIPHDTFYAVNMYHYRNVPHELLAEAKWHLGDRAMSKVHFDKALEFEPTSSKLLYEYRYHYGLPKISILLPTLGRPEGTAKCLASIKGLNYPAELIEVVHQEDEPRLGLSKRVAELYKESTGEYCVFAANDTTFEPDCLILALIAMKKENKGLGSFNTGDPILPDEGNINTHFMIKRDLVEKIGGEIFSTKLNHIGVDNLLWAQCKKLNEAMYCKDARIVHNHFSNGKAVMDDTYRSSWDRVEEDRKILAEELSKI